MSVRILRYCLIVNCFGLLLFLEQTLFPNDNETKGLQYLMGGVCLLTILFILRFIPIVQQVQQRESAATNPWTPPQAKTALTDKIRPTCSKLFLRFKAASTKRNPNSAKPQP